MKYLFLSRLDPTYVKILEFMLIMNIDHLSRLLMKILILFIIENALVAHETYFQIKFGTYLIVIIITLGHQTKNIN